MLLLNNCIVRKSELLKIYPDLHGQNDLLFHVHLTGCTYSAIILFRIEPLTSNYEKAGTDF